MSSEILEIVKLPDGGVALCNSDDAEAVITIKFSEKTLLSLKDEKHLDVAQVMIAAAVQMIAEVKRNESEVAREEQEPTIH